MFSINNHDHNSSTTQINIDLSLNTLETENLEQKFFKSNNKQFINKKKFLNRFRNLFILINCLFALFIDGMLYINVESFFPLYVE